MKPIRVLNVEDSLDDYELLVRHLTKNGYEVYSERVEMAADMRNAISAQPWDVIVSDYRMPNFSGLEALAVLKESGLDIPFIIISGTIGEETAVQAMLNGANDYMMKNNLSRLVPAIEREMQEVGNRRARREAEQSLKQSEERYRVVAETASDAILTVNEESKIIFANRATEQIFGYSVEELIGSELTILMPEYLKANHLAGFRRYLETGEKHLKWQGLEVPAVRKDGKLITVQVSFGEYKNNGTHIFTGILRDVTESKLAEQALRESEENYRALVKATSQFVWMIDPEGKSVDLPVWWQALTGQTPEESDGTGWLKVVHPDDRERARLTWEASFNAKSLFYIEYAVLSKKKEYCYLSLRGVPVCDSDGNFCRWIGTVDDVTERRHAEEALRSSEEQLRQSQKLESIGRLAGGIAHDFNNMLTAINGYSELTLRSLRVDDSLRGNIEEIKKAGERSAALTRQLLAFSRQQILQERVLDINEIILETSAMLKRLVGENYELVSILDPETGQIKVDPGQISQVLMNLVVNSSDAMPTGGMITIETRNVDLDASYSYNHISVKPGPYVMLAVSDNGIGIDEETKQRIFEPFFTTKGVGKGTGLGLSTVYGIVKQSGGNVWVYSEVGEGTTFKIYFPRVEEDVKAVEKINGSTGFQVGTETILLVEDEEVVRKLSHDILKTCGYEVIEAKNGLDAIKISEQAGLQIDLLLTDVVMPQMGGRELAVKLSLKYPKMKVLFTSGYTDDAIVRHGIIDEGTNFIQKPFTLDALIEKVRETLDTNIK